jgi:hypothetical protein
MIYGRVTLVHIQKQRHNNNQINHENLTYHCMTLPYLINGLMWLYQISLMDASPLQRLYWEHLSWAGFQLTTVIGIGTDCIVSCKSNYHSITTAPKLCNTVSIKQKYTIYMQRNLKINKSVVFSQTPVSSTNKTEIFLKVAVNTIKLKHG